MKFWSSEHTFQHCWEKVTQAAWRKYPNELNPNVKTLDVLDRHIDSEGRLHTTRLMGAEGLLPSWVNRIIGLEEQTYVVEESIVNPVDKTMTLQSKNTSLSNWVAVEETLVYSQHPDDKERTLQSHGATIKVFGISFKDYCENLIKSTMAANAGKGRQAMENVIAKINREMQDIAANLEQATTRLNTEFEQAKQGLEHAARLPQVMCEGSTSSS